MDGPPEQEKAPRAVVTGSGGKAYRAKRAVSALAADVAGSCPVVKRWVWGWPAWVGTRWMHGKGVRK